MTVRDLLAQLAREGLVDGAALDPATPAGAAARAALQPYARASLRVQQAGGSVSVWFGALLLALFLLENDIHELPALALLLGVGALALARAIAAESVTLLRLQLLWVAVIFGQALVIAALAELTDALVPLALAIVALEAVTLAAIPNLAVGAAAVGAAVAALCVLLDDANLERPGYDLLALSLGTCASLLWAYEAPLVARLGRLWQPLAYTLPVALLAPMVAAVQDRGDAPWTPAITLGWAALAAWLIGQAGREAPALRGRPRLLAWAAIGLAAALGPGAPGLSAGVALLVLSHLRRNLALQSLALTTFGGFLFVWYYELASPLMTKSLAAVGHGLVFLLAAAALRRGAGRPREREVRPLRARIGELRWLTLALGLALAVPGWITYEKERVLAAGETVLLRLRPVDPRSLMQGDYMRLAYAITDEVPDRDALAPRGALVVTRDADGVARFVRVDDGRPLAPGELRLRYFLHGDRVALGAETFFFPEGRADELEGAAYGELALGEAGDSVLLGLRDAARRPVGPRPHGR